MEKNKEQDQDLEIFPLNNYLDETRPLPEYIEKKPGQFYRYGDTDITISANLDLYKLIFTKERPNYNIYFRAIKNF